MSVFIKKVIYMGFLFLLRLVGTTSLNCTSIKNQEAININSSNPIFYHFSIKINKCSSNCNNINNQYAEICVADFMKFKC